MNAQSTIAAAPMTPISWDQAKAAYLAASAAEAAFDATHWRPAYTAHSAGGSAIPDGLDGEMERLGDVRCDAEEVLVGVTAPDIAGVLFKVECSRKRWADFEGWPNETLDAIVADLRRLSAPETQATKEQERTDFAAILSPTEVTAFRDHGLNDRAAWLLVALNAATKDRNGILDMMRSMTLEEDADGTSICGLVEAFQNLLQWCEETTAIVRAVSLRVLLVAEQVAEERGELNDEVLA